MHTTLNLARLRPLRRQSFLFALLLLVVAVAVNSSQQPNFFQLRVLSGNLRTYLPLMILAAGQTIVVIAGGIDLSVGAIVSLSNVVAVRALGTDPSPGQVVLALALALGAGLAVGAFNGFCVAYVRLQPIVTTFASSFVIAGLALQVMPSPGGVVPDGLSAPYRSNPLNIPLTLWVMAALIGLWGLVRLTRFRRYLYAVGGAPQAAYATGVPVSLVRLSSYLVSGGMAALAGIAMTLSTTTGDPRIGDPMTLGSIVAVVLGGTRLSGGQGGVTGSLIGVLVLGLVRSIITFANVPLWWQTLADSLIILIALAGPGLFNALRRRTA
ncbi:MAG TPA: ABC transporter permease [Herpetosiphonaceae bacterium]|nr:ABC transporter permease [Herpetosiphonaceae bacterium]